MPDPTPPPADDPLRQHSAGGLLRIGIGATGPSAPGAQWEPPSPEELQRSLPQYEISELLGRGGMGAVYRARQIELDRAVAIKLLPLEVSADVEFTERFRREARAMAKLEHPNIVGVFDFGTTPEGCLFFVMEFVDGSNLHQIIQAGGLAPAEALEIVGQVCDALAYAHGEGIVHRDIKPANVMVSRRGKVKVADFGLARLIDPAAASLGHTTTGMVMGTPDYMAPEQKTGMNVDHRADIYSVGVMLYEALTGEVPRGVFEPPSRRVKVSTRIDALVTRAMQAKPEARFQNTTEIKKVVEQESAALARAPQAAKRGRWFGLAAVVLVLGGLAFLFRPAKVRPVREETSPSPVAATVDLLKLVDPKRDTVMGEWEMTPDGLVVTKTEKYQLLGFNYAPPAEYDYEIEFTVHDGGAPEAHQVLAVAGKELRWRMGYGFLDPAPFGFGKYFDDQRLDNVARTEAKVFRPPLELEKRHRSVVEVRRSSLRAVVDGEEVLKWSGNFGRLGETNDPTLPDLAHLGLGTFGAHVTFHKAEVRPPGASAAATPAAAKEAPLVNDLGMKFLPVPITGGPTHGKRVLFSVWETRVQDYRVFANETKREWPPTFSQTPTHPAVNVSWDDAQAFCVWLTERERKAGRLDAGQTYRLPSDHEWSCAAGIGALENATKTRADNNALLPDNYVWGKQWPPPSGAGNMAGEEFRAEFKSGEHKASVATLLPGWRDPFVFTAPVGSFEANTFGLFDLCGNASEWCQDWFDREQKARVTRGGSWAGGIRDTCRAAWGNPISPDSRYYVVGFRCVLAPARPEDTPTAKKSAEGPSLVEPGWALERSWGPWSEGGALGAVAVHPITGEIWFSREKPGALFRIDSAGRVAQAQAVKYASLAFASGSLALAPGGPAFWGSDFTLVRKLDPTTGASLGTVPDFDPAHENDPSAIVLVPAEWKGGLGLKPGDALIADEGRTTQKTQPPADPALWLIPADGSAPRVLADLRGKTSACHLACSTRALFVACKMPGENAAGLFRLDEGGRLAPIDSPVRTDIVRALVWDKAHDSLIVALKDGRLVRLRGSTAPDRMMSEPIGSGFGELTSDGLALSSDGLRLFVADDTSGKLYKYRREPTTTTVSSTATDSKSAPVIVDPAWRIAGTWRPKFAPNSAHYADAAEVVFTGGREGGFAIDRATGVERSLATFDGWHIAVSPDRHWLVWSSGAGNGSLGRAELVPVFRPLPSLKETAADQDDDPKGFVFIPDDWQGGSPLRAGDVLVTDSGFKGPDGLWLFRCDSDAAPEQLVEKFERDFDMADVTATARAVYVCNRVSQRTKSEPGQPEDLTQRVLRFEAGRLLPCRTDQPIFDSSAIVADPRTGVLYVLEGKQLVSETALHRLLQLTPGSQPDTFTVRVIATHFAKPSDAGLDLSADGKRLLVTDEGAGVIYEFRRE